MPIFYNQTIKNTHHQTLMMKVYTSNQITSLAAAAAVFIQTGPEVEKPALGSKSPLSTETILVQ